MAIVFKFADQQHIAAHMLPDWLYLLCLCRISYSRRDLSNRVYASDEGRAAALEKAEKLESTLEGQLPSFVKSMLQSHVTGGFWLVSIIIFMGFS